MVDMLKHAMNNYWYDCVQINEFLNPTCFWVMIWLFCIQHFHIFMGRMVLRMSLILDELT